MKQFLRVLHPSIVLAIFVAAIWLLYRELSGFQFEEFQAGLRDIDAREIAWALGLTVVNYVILFGYDYLAIRYLRHPLPAWKLMLASFVGNVASLNFGSLLGGTSVRYRFYSHWKFSALEILQLVVILGITFWLGVCLLAGIVFLAADFPIPPQIAGILQEGMVSLLGARMAERLTVDVAVRIAGAALVALVLGYLAVCALGRVRKWKVPLPPPWLSLGQIAVSCADLMVVAGVFYVLLPDAAQRGHGYFEALGVFLLGWVVAAFSHIPGGLGVFELIMVVFLEEKKAIATALVFRAIYLLFPMVIAGCLLVGHEVLVGRRYLKRLADLPAVHVGGRREPRRRDAQEGPVREAKLGPAGNSGDSPP
jgi:uncharacterized membrane protein YbhN (UPF0104 family)